MVNAQTWLDKVYPKEKRSKVSEILLNEPNVEGELDLKDFTHQDCSIYIFPEVDENKLTFKKPMLVKVNLINAQRDINYHYPTKESKEKETELDITLLTTHVILSDKK